MDVLGGKMTRGITVVATMTSVMESAGSAVAPANLFQAQVESTIVLPLMEETR